MDDSLAKKLPNPEDKANGNGGPPELIVLTIKVHPVSRATVVDGPTDDRGLVYLMLELARATVDEHYMLQRLEQEARKHLIVAPDGGLPPLPRR